MKGTLNMKFDTFVWGEYQDLDVENDIEWAPRASITDDIMESVGIKPEDLDSWRIGRLRGAWERPGPNAVVYPKNALVLCDEYGMLEIECLSAPKTPS
jgi:hypothetical protein